MADERSKAYVARRAVRAAGGREGGFASNKMAARITRQLKAQGGKVLQTVRDASQSGKVSPVEGNTRLAAKQAQRAEKAAKAVEELASSGRGAAVGAGRVRIIGRAIARGVLSPAVLTESVAGSAVAEARKRQWKTDTRPEDIASKRSAGKMKPVKRKA